jgi:hypothetical protein
MKAQGVLSETFIILVTSQVQKHLESFGRSTNTLPGGRGTQ